MTRSNHCIVILLIFVAVTALVASAKANEHIGIVKEVSGACSIIRANQTIVAKRDLQVMLNDEISTKTKSQISIRFKEDTQLILGETSRATIDTFFFSGADSDLLFTFSTGTFRAITGKIVEANPEAFNMQTPHTTLGIRGSDVYALIGIVEEEVGALDLGPNHVLEITTAKQTVKITKPGLRSKISFSGVISLPSPIPPKRLKQMKSLGTPAPPTPKGKTNHKSIPQFPATPTRVIVTPPPPPPSSPKPKPQFH